MYSLLLKCVHPHVDGCPAEITVCGNIDSVMWPETEIDSTSKLPCPCGSTMSLFNDLGIIATRKCMGDFETGARWSFSECSNCTLTGTTSSLCKLFDVSKII